MRRLVGRTTSEQPDGPDGEDVEMHEQLGHLVEEMLNKGILYEDVRREIEKHFIRRALKQSNGSVGRAAELLGVHRNTLSRKIATYRLTRTG